MPMAQKKSDLSPEVKARLRRAVLGEISSDKPKNIQKTAIVESSVGQPERFAKLQLKTIAKPVAKAVQPKAIAIEKPMEKILTEETIIDNVDKNVSKKISDKLSKKSPKKKIKSLNNMEKKVIKKATKVDKPVKAPAKKTKATKTKPPKAAKGAPIKIEGEEVKPKAMVSKSGFYAKKPQPVMHDWEKPEPQEQSLEALFNQPTSSFSKTGGFFKKTTAKPVASKVGVSVKSVSTLFAKNKQEVPVKKRGLKSFLALIVFVILVFALLLGFDILGIYQLGFRDNVSYQTAKILHLPAGSINGKMISVTAYLDDLQVLNLPLSEKREGLIDYSNQTDIKSKIFYRLAAFDLMAERLADYKKAVTNEDVDKQMSLLVQQIGSEDQAAKNVNDLYDLNLDQFKDKVVRPMLLRENLQQAIMDDDSLAINKLAKTKAEEILVLAESTTADFAALVKQYSNDEASLNIGGDIGWVVKGQLDPQWENLVFNASSSTVIPQLIKSGFGYHIIKVDQKLVDTETEKESVRLKHILFKVDVDEYIRGLLNDANLIKYIK